MEDKIVKALDSINWSLRFVFWTLAVIAGVLIGS